MKTFRKLSVIACIVLTSLLSSCADYLNVSDQLAAELDMEEVFNNTGYTRRFHRYIYSGIPNVSNIIHADGIGGLDNPWASIADEIKCAQGNTRDMPTIGYHAGNASFGRWGLYQRIRQANLFLENAHVIPESGDTGNFIDETELVRLKNEARFLRAYYHYLLFELYGPIPIMTTIADPSSVELDYSRASVDEIVKFIDTELNACYDELPEKEKKDREAAPTKGAALAILAKLHVYAASPLFNGGYNEAVALRDNEGKQLFPEKDDTKWQTALNAVERFITYANEHYELYKVVDKDGDLNVAESLYKLFQEAEDNPEIIWATSKNPWGGVNNDGRERRCTPRAAYEGFSCVGVMQEAIDDFFMADGKDIHESPLYDVEKEGEAGSDGVPNMYKNREPRFYRDVTYSGKVWQKTTDKIVYFYKGQKDDNSQGDQCYTGTLLYKGMNKELLNRGSEKKSQYRPGIIFRLADFYLLYAEALNEVNPADTRIVEYIDKVRERAGIPLLKDIHPEIIGNKELQQKAIRRERRIELFVEGQRYFDVRRWMIADKEEGRQSGEFHGMNMNGTTLEEFMKRTPFEKRVFEKRMYIYPLPLNEIQKSKKLVQNPGW